MKFDFLNVLKNEEMNSDQLGEQTGELNRKIQESEKRVEETEAHRKDLRKQELSGDAVPASASQNADSDYQSAKLDLEIFTEKRDELIRKLPSVIEKERREREQRNSEQRAKLNALKAEAMRELAAAFGRFEALAETAGYRGTNEHDYVSLIREHSGDYLAAYDAEISKIKCPTLADLEERYERESSWLQNFNADREIEQLLRMYQR